MAAIQLNSDFIMKPIWSLYKFLATRPNQTMSIAKNVTKVIPYTIKCFNICTSFIRVVINNVEFFWGYEAFPYRKKHLMDPPTRSSACKFVI